MVGFDDDDDNDNFHSYFYSDRYRMCSQFYHFIITSSQVNSKPLLNSNLLQNHQLSSEQLKGLWRKFCCGGGVDNDVAAADDDKTSGGGDSVAADDDSDNFDDYDDHINVDAYVIFIILIGKCVSA